MTIGKVPCIGLAREGTSRLPPAKVVSAMTLFHVGAFTTVGELVFGRDQAQGRIIPLTIAPRVSEGPVPIPESMHAPRKEL